MGRAPSAVLHVLKKKKFFLFHHHSRIRITAWVNWETGGIKLKCNWRPEGVSVGLNLHSRHQTWGLNLEWSTEGSGLQWTGQPEPHCIKHKAGKLLLISKSRLGWAVWHGLVPDLWTLRPTSLLDLIQYKSLLPISECVGYLGRTFVPSCVASETKQKAVCRRWGHKIPYCALFQTHDTTPVTQRTTSSSTTMSQRVHHAVTVGQRRPAGYTAHKKTFNNWTLSFVAIGWTRREVPR